MNASASGGFRLDSLLKLADTRANVGRQTLLHYIAGLSQREFDPLPSFRNTCAHVYSAVKGSRQQLRFLFGFFVVVVVV